MSRGILAAQKALFSVAVMSLPLLLASCGRNTELTVTPTLTSAPVGSSIWVGAWGDAITNAEHGRDNGGGNDESFRFLVTPTIGGTEERIRFANTFSASSVIVGSARLSVGTDGSPAVDSTRDAPLTFNGQPAVTLAPGGTAVSDPVHVPFTFGEVLAISLFLKGSFGPVARHDSIFITNYRSGANSGDRTTDTLGTGYTGQLSDWLLITGVDVYGSYSGTVALFGSSTTDGYHANYSSDQLYPNPNVPVPGQHRSRLSDWLAHRLNAAGYQVGVVNAGVPGDTVTVDITNSINHVQNANDRIARDVLALPNLVGIVTYFGSIDIRSPDCKSAPAIEAATQQMISTAHAAKVPLVLATIPPSAFCSNPAQSNFGPLPSPTTPYNGGVTPGPANGGELQRVDLNTWIRGTGRTLPGVAGIADFDAALADPTHPSFLQPPFNSGDNFHPNGAGYGAEAAAIPLNQLLPGVAH